MKKALSIKKKKPDPWFPKMEKELHARFTHRRRKGRKVSSRWLTFTAKSIHRKNQEAEPNTSESKRVFRASPGWRIRFAARNKMAIRKKSNSRSQSVEFRLPSLRAYHLATRKMLIVEDVAQRKPQYSLKWGRFPDNARMNVDQVPLAFVSDMSTTWDVKGASRVWISQPGGGALEKRQATLQLLLRARSRQPKPAVIFRGTGQRITGAERAAYDPDVHVYFQPKAWADTNFCVQWARRSLKEALKEFKGQESLLFLDNLSAHRSDEFKAELKKLNVLPWFEPANSTELAQPVDNGAGLEYKQAIARHFALWMDDDANMEKWEDGNLGASERRVLMTLWVSSKLNSFLFVPYSM